MVWLPLCKLHPISFPDRKIVWVSYWVSGNKTSSTLNPKPQSGSTILSRASAHGRSQFKLQNLGVGGYTKCLNGTTIPEQGATPDVKLAAMGPNRLASSVRPCFVKASSTVEKAVSCYKADRLVALLLSFRSVQSSPAVREFRAAREERCEPSNRQVCANLMSWRPKHIRAVSSVDLPSDSLHKN